VSLNVIVEGKAMTANALFGEHATENDYMKDQTTFTQFYAGFGFYGTLKKVTTETMYKIKSSVAKDITFTGKPAALPFTKSLPVGWAYMPCPYVVSTKFPGNVFTGSFDQNDLIKSQTKFSTFYDGFGWYGLLRSFDPGQGYKLKVKSAGDRIYNAPARRSLADE